jgi:hypothetical protein
MTFLAFRMNGLLDEEEAIQNAITASLEEETLRHAHPRGVPILDPDADIIERSYQAVMGMTKTLDQRIRGLLAMKFESGLPPGRSIPMLPPDHSPAKSPPKQSPRSAARELRQEQDREYEEVLRQAQEAEQPPADDPPEPIGEIEPEPDTGIQIAVAIGSERKARRFRPDARAEQMFWWIATEQGVANGSFELVGPVGALAPELTFAEQEIGNKTLVHYTPI